MREEEPKGEDDGEATYAALTEREETGRLRRLGKRDARTCLSLAGLGCDAGVALVVSGSADPACVIPCQRSVDIEFDLVPCLVACLAAGIAWLPGSLASFSAARAEL